MLQMAVRYSGLARARIRRNGAIPDKHFEQNTEGSLLLFVEHSVTLHAVFSELSNYQCD
jgi:hypothetical protein